MKVNPIIKILIKNGLYAGAILAAYFLLVYLVNMNYLQWTNSFITLIVQGIVLLLFSFFSISQSRKELPDNRIKFLPAWLAAGGTYFIGLAIFGIAKLLILFVIDVDYMNSCVDKNIAFIMEYADQVPNISDAIAQYEETRKPISTVLQIVVSYPIVAVIIGAFIALVAKKKNRLEETL